jgi:hypothetical protein
MAKPRPQIEGSLAEELYAHFKVFVGTKGCVPLEHAFWVWLLAKGHYTKASLPEWVFRWQFKRLVEHKWLAIEPETRSIIPLRDIEIKVKPD